MPAWYRSGTAREKALAYYRQLRRLLHGRPELRGLLVRCRICRVFFLTHPRNAGRNDLRCHFGCLPHDQARKSTDRSADYYRSQQGKAKKRELNARRGGDKGGKTQKKDLSPVPVEPRPEVAAQPLPPALPMLPIVTAPVPVAEPASESVERACPSLLSYLAMLLGLIELRSVMLREVCEVLRQHGIDLAPLRLQYRRGRGQGPPSGENA